MSRCVLVVAAHPDDEVLGCGATMAKHARRGDRVHVLILSEGITSRGGAPDRSAFGRDLAELAAAARRANDVLGVHALELAQLPDNRMDAVDLLDIVRPVEERVLRIRPQIVYTHFGGDLNIDHVLTHRAVLTACRPLPGGGVDTMLFFEVPSSTDWYVGGQGGGFVPTWFEDVSETLDAKKRALEAYGGEMRPWPHARSLDAVEHLARWRGATVGLGAAEAFVLGRAVRTAV